MRLESPETATPQPPRDALPSGGIATKTPGANDLDKYERAALNRFGRLPSRTPAPPAQPPARTVPVSQLAFAKDLAASELAAFTRIFLAGAKRVVR